MTHQVSHLQARLFTPHRLSPFASRPRLGISHKSPRQRSIASFASRAPSAAASLASPSNAFAVSQSSSSTRPNDRRRTILPPTISQSSSLSSSSHSHSPMPKPPGPRTNSSTLPPQADTIERASYKVSSPLSPLSSSADGEANQSREQRTLSFRGLDAGGSEDGDGVEDWESLSQHIAEGRGERAEQAVREAHEGDRDIFGESI